MRCVRTRQRWYRLLVLFALMLLTSGCMLMGVRTVEEARYDVVEAEANIELRNYQEVVVAQTYVDIEDWDDAGSVGFRRLANYIFGGNVAEESIAMTAPVLLANTREELSMTAPVLRSRGAQGWLMSFVLPAEYTLDSAPRPLDDRVQLVVAGSRRVAVARYSGSFTEEAAREHQAELLAWVGERGLEPLSDVIYAGFDPPWTLPPLRRNEVWLHVR